MLNRDQENSFYLVVADLIEDVIKPKNQKEIYALSDELQQIIEIVVEDQICDNNIPEV